MICVIALIVFGIMGIFSATHRAVAKEAFDCVFRKITFRKCKSRLDVRLKSQITGKIIKLSPRTARFVYKHFEIISWAFLILFFVSFVYASIGGYNYYLYGNCNGPNEDGFCIFDPLGHNSEISSGVSQETCAAEPPSPKYLTLANVDLTVFPTYDRNANNDVIFMGCYACPYTRESYPTIRKLLDREDVNFIFAHFPAKDNTNHISNILNCIYEVDKQKFIKANDVIYEGDVLQLHNEEYLFGIVENMGLDVDTIRACSISNETLNLTSIQTAEAVKTGIYGTPTVFVNGNAVVGPKPYRVYKRLLN